jgi:hypothetical protein
MQRLVSELARQGRKLGITYSSRQPFAPPEAYVNPPDLVAALNDKASLGDLLPPEAVPERRVVEHRDLARLLAGQRFPIVLKASSRLGSGGGADVLICGAPADIGAAEAKFLRASRVVVERFYEFTASWCVHFALGPAGVRSCGVAQQVCDAAGTYQGNWCGSGFAAAQEAVDLARHAADAGWAQGYRGFLGVDVGRTAGGRHLGFDVNFRNNGSTPQVVLHDAIADAWDAPVTRLCLGVRFAGAFATMLERLSAAHARKELVPLLAFDTPSAAEGEPPHCNVIVAGGTTGAVEAILTRLSRDGFTMP